MSVRHRVTCSIPRLALGAAFVCLMVSPIAAQNAAQPAAPAAQATDTSRFRAGRPDGRPLDGAQHAVRRHPHRRDESGGRGCGCRPAARSADRRQERRNGEPDRVGRRPAPSVRRRGRSRRDDAPADVSAALSGRGHSRRDERREHHPDRQRVEQRRDAARGRDRRRDVEQDRASSTCCSCPAAPRASR